MRRIYCSDAARLRGDDNIASAARVDVWILVELPITWGRDPLFDAAMPASVRDTLRNALRTIQRSRIVFIRRRVECLGAVRVFVIRSAPKTGVAMRDLASIDDVATLSFASMLDELQPPKQPIVLVCTHGQHDSCCGRRGYPLFDALQRREDLDVWQCSHIGGDRFAANALVLPWGLYYGPVESRDANVLADTIARNEIFLPGYRGRSSLSRPVQAAETFIRRTTNDLRRDALKLTTRETLVDGRLRITLRDDEGTQHEVTMEHYIAAENVLATCAAKEEQAIRQFRLVEYRIVD
ncbi:MAG: sucrase ferredoxin [Thermoanaerobaculia bacterium]